MRLQTTCRLVFNIEIPTPFILMLRPRSGDHQWVSRDEYKITPSVPVVEFTDNYGNLCQRLTAPSGDFSIHTSAVVDVAEFVDEGPGDCFVEVQDLPDNVLNFLLPSRYCESDRFGVMATEITANKTLGYDQVVAIEDWLRGNISYDPGTSNVPVSAVEVNLKQSGVCRDLAHLGIALCRSLCIPARMVVGYLHGLKPMDMHAWFEAFVGGRWYTFDATQKSGPKGGYVAIGYGQDAADVAVFNQFGQSIYVMEHYISVERLSDDV